MEKRRFIQVVLPLPLEWEPYYVLPEGVSASIGDRVRVPFAGKEYQAVVTVSPATPSIDASKVKEIIALEENVQPVTLQEIRLWRFISDYYLCTLGEVYLAAYPSSRREDEKTAERIRRRLEERQLKASAARRAALERLNKRKAAKEEKLSKARKDTVKEKLAEELEAIERQIDSLLQELPPAPEEALHGKDIVLSKGQMAAVRKIEEAFSKGKNVLLQGVTGSGKTEIYLHLAREVVSRGKNVLYMAPEIAMGIQLSSRIESIFPDTFHAYSSGATPARRRAAAQAMQDGQYVLLGTRSAIFLPHRNLGLIIIDEEHDTSYKQESPSPRYNARDCAVVLAAMSGCPVILGSATPSMESLFNCRTGRYALVTLDEKYYGTGKTSLEIIDTKAESRKRGMKGSFSIKLIEAIRATLSAGRQVMILRARRSYSPAVQCDSCSSIIKCPRCNVALSYHADRERLICHYCGHSEPFTGVCPSCGGRLIPIGAGTQKIEEEASALFPEAKIARLDSDTPTALSEKIVDAFDKGETDILIGTQILAKGFDFPGVALTVIMQADSLLSLDDFRADEKAVQLLSQLWGRSGRRGGESRFIIQTSQAGHPVYSMLRGDPTFTDAMLRERKEFFCPPFSRSIVLILRDSNLPRLEKLSSELCHDLSLPGISLFGPYAPAVDRISGRYIRHIRLSLPRDAALSENKKKIALRVASFAKTKAWTGHINIDVDPS